jgi:hypothetical protein
MTFCLSAHIWYARRGSHRDHDVPNLPMVLIMLAEIERQLACLSAKPVQIVDCEYWPKDIGGSAHAGDQLARITIEAEPGEPTRPLRSWFQWQHPRWREGDPVPFRNNRPVSAIDGVAPALLPARERA